MVCGRQSEIPRTGGWEKFCFNSRRDCVQRCVAGGHYFGTKTDKRWYERGCLRRSTSCTGRPCCFYWRINYIFSFFVSVIYLLNIREAFHNTTLERIRGFFGSWIVPCNSMTEINYWDEAKCRTRLDIQYGTCTNMLDVHVLWLPLV